MTLRSMTGFARSDGASGSMRWHWELRSVNGRGLDVRTRLPPGYDALEPQLRDMIAKRITRGNLTVNLVIESGATVSEIRVNETALAQVMGIVDRLEATGRFAKSSPEGVLSVRGVLEISDIVESAETRAARYHEILGSFEVALAALADARQAEGSRLEPVLAGQLAIVERVVAAVAMAPGRSAETIRQRLAEQLARLRDANTGLDEARLYQEAALIATRNDVEEELKRLTSHVAAARDLIASPEPVGRKFDFLAQEFNREANTLCSKASDVEITKLGLELKAVIDQMREQVQNLE